MPEEALILKRNPDAEYSESYNVLFEGRHVGRIYKAVSHAPREAPWFWGLDFFEWQGSDGPQYGQVASLEAAKQVLPHRLGSQTEGARKSLMNGERSSIASCPVSKCALGQNRCRC